VGKSISVGDLTRQKRDPDVNKGFRGVGDGENEASLTSTTNLRYTRRTQHVMQRRASSKIARAALANTKK
jgi:hypothetical protein